MSENKNNNFLNDKFYDVPKRKTERKYTLSTVIYQKFGKGENKKKRYEKITNEIKKVEANSKKVWLKLSTHISNLGKKLDEEKELHKNELEDINSEFNYNMQSKIINLQSKKLTLMELEKDSKYNYYEVIKRLKILPEKRTIRDILRIKAYLIQSKLGINIAEEFSDKNTVEKLINFCSIEMRYYHYKKGEIIAKIGEKLDSFYSIIQGKVDIMKPFEKVVSMTGFQYFKYLMDLKKNKENYIINLCVKSNEKNFVIETNHVDILHYIFLLNYLDYIHINKKQPNELDDILNIIDFNYEEFGLTPAKFNSQNYNYDYFKIIKKRLHYISHILFDQYSFFNDNRDKKEVTIYEYKKIMELKSNDFFGDTMIENKASINETIIAEEDCDVAYLSNKLYSEQIASEKSILLDQKISDLHQNHFFRLIKYGKFAKKYYKLFINQKYEKGDTIFNEDDEIKYLYFIIEGSVQLSLTKSIKEIDYLIDILYDKQEIIKENNKLDLKLQDLTEDNYNYEQIYENNNSYVLTSYNEEIDINYLNQKQKNKLIILNNHEDLGIISYILGNKYICSCNVVSNIANVYKLEINHLKLILAHEFECKEEFFERLKYKIDLIKERLLIISNIKIVMKGKKEKEKSINMDNNNIKKKISKNNNINAIIDYDKIKFDLNSSYTSKLNSSPQGKYSIENINLPLLNAYRIKESKTINFSPDKKWKEDSNEMSKSKIVSLMKKGLQFNLNEIRKNKIINQKKRIKSAKKWKIEDKMILNIQKSIKDFSKNKFNMLNHKISKKSNNNIKSHYKIYLTQINIKNNIKPFTERESTRFNITTKKETIPISPKINIVDKLLSYSDKDKNQQNQNNKKLVANDVNIRFNTEGNVINNQKNNKANKTYKNPLSLIKQEKYKIFDKVNLSNKYNIDYISESIEKMRELKKIYSNMKQNASPSYHRKKNFKKNSKE